MTLSNGVPIESISKMLGHTTIRTTQTYAKVVERKLSEDMANFKKKGCGLRIFTIALMQKHYGKYC
ncbi:hypothetical protein [Pedobacter sp. D749]|uniref:hypothetical protein n=1 Tax=Pedobacter sp. D749 TaxID=2856523 RepID=UPI0021065BCE|nr:hypothetical protein [Pedobacter sp. D749]